MYKSIHPGMEKTTSNPTSLNNLEKTTRTPTGFTDQLYALIAANIKELEWLFSQNKKLFLLYGRLFYGKVLQKELAGKNLPRGARILHIGCGALPYTAYHLALQGYSIDAVDSDRYAIAQAQHLIHALGLESKIRLINQNGMHTSSKDYDAIWISLHVTDKTKVLNNAVKQARPGTWIIYREPRAWLSLIYTNINPDPALDALRQSSLNHCLGKKSVSIKTPERKLNNGKND